MLGIYFGLFRSQHSSKLGMHTFIQNVSDLSEHVWKAAGLQHANATDLLLCKSSSLQTSTLPTCIARCLPKCAPHFYSPADTSKSTLCSQPNRSSAFHLSNLLSCFREQAGAKMLKLSQPELGASTLMLGIYVLGCFDRCTQNSVECTHSSKTCRIC